jgi:hypothetical protein
VLALGLGSGPTVVGSDTVGVTAMAVPAMSPVPGPAAPATRPSGTPPISLPITLPKTSPVPARRNVYAWPFAWNSIWNLPISTRASYHSVHLAVDGRQIWNRGVLVDPENISVDPRLPVRTVLAGGKPVQAHVDTSLAGNRDVVGNWNNCSAFLSASGTSIYQGQPLDYRVGRPPSYRYHWPSVSLKGPGTGGCHGGSGLSGLGGTIRKGEMAAASPLRHALKIELDCIIYCSRKGNGGKGYTWPAVAADGGFKDPRNVNYYDRFGTADRSVLQGSLLALRPGFKVSSLRSAHARKVAQALLDYGGYVVDNTAVSGSNPRATKGVNAFAVQRGAEVEFPDRGCPGVSARTTRQDGCTFYRDLQTTFANLAVVANNTAATPGGGAIGTPRRAAYAPAFGDGSGAPPGLR